MKAELLPKGPPDCPILRLYDFRVAEVRYLRTLCLGLADGSAQRADLPAEPVNGCRLTLSVGPWDEGILRGDDPGQFECRLTPDGWQGVAEMMTPFCAGENWGRFQWLSETSGISLLLSQSGQW